MGLGLWRAEKCEGWRERCHLGTPLVPAEAFALVLLHSWCPEWPLPFACCLVFCFSWKILHQKPRRAELAAWFFPHHFVPSASSRLPGVFSKGWKCPWPTLAHGHRRSLRRHSEREQRKGSPGSAQHLILRSGIGRPRAVSEEKRVPSTVRAGSREEWGEGN